MIKKITTLLLAGIIMLGASTASALTVTTNTYLQAVITTEEAIEIQKSAIFDASQSFIANSEEEVQYFWDFGDGNKDEGLEVLHAYKEAGTYTVKLEVNDGFNIASSESKIFAYKKLAVLITDQEAAKDRIELITKSAAENGSYLKVIESFGSSTEFIAEEVLTKKLTEQSAVLQKANQIIVWTKENSGLNAISRYIRNNPEKVSNNFNQKTITVVEKNVSGSENRIQKQFDQIRPEKIIIAKESIVQLIMQGLSNEEIITSLDKGGYEYKVINEKTGKLRPWNFMSYFVNILISNGIPDNTIALLLLLPVIATVVAFMKQVVGVTTFGIYTPSIITLSFLIIGVEAGLLTLAISIAAGSAMRPILKKARMLFIPKMAIVITVVSLTLLFVLIASINLGLFNADFLSIAIFPMLILATLVEKFVSAKTEKGLSSATVLMVETVLVSIIAYFIAGGEINLGFTSIKFNMIKNAMLTYPELILVLIVINVVLGKWSGLRILERIRFKEVLRHIEE